MTQTNTFSRRPAGAYPSMPRLIMAHSLEAVMKLHKILGGPVPVDYSTFATENDLFIAGSGYELEEAQRRLQNDIAFFNSGRQVNLYHVFTPEAVAAAEKDVPTPGLSAGRRWSHPWGELVGGRWSHPWGERTPFLSREVWFIDKNDLATNVRCSPAEPSGRLIRLKDHHFDIELLRTEEPTALTGDIYSREGVERIVNSEQFQERVRNGQLLGMLAPIPTHLQIMNLDFSKVACRVTRVELVDGVVRGDVELIGPQAQTVREMIYGTDYVFGARIFAGVEMERDDGTRYKVVRNLVTWDIVAAP